MKRLIFGPLLLVLTWLAPHLLMAQGDERQSWIVRLDRPAGTKEVADLLRPLLPDGARLVALRSLVPTQFRPTTSSAPSQSLARYHVVEITGTAPLRASNVPGIEIFPNHIYNVERHDDDDHLDPFRHDQWGLDAIRIDGAWERTTGSATVVIGILDTGVELDHPDLAPNVYVNPAEDLNGNGRFDPWGAATIVDGVSGDLDGIDQDRNGYVDDVSGFDFVDQVTANLGDWSGRDGVAEDEQGHGTLVAGVAGAKGGNSRGISGVAPDCRIMSLRAFDATGDGEDDDIAAAIVYAADNGVDVLNMSFGDLYRSPLLADAVRYASERGVLMVASSGNNGIPDPHYPSGFPEVMSVGATRPDSLLSFFSAFGSSMSLVAPGEDILTTARDRDYRVVSGTSFSAPHVSGVAALYRSLYPDRNAGEIRYALEYGAWDVGDAGWDIDFGAGLLDATRALGIPGGGRFSILSPRSDSGLAESAPTPVTGSVIGVGLRSWSLSWGDGETPEDWTEIGGDSSAVLLGELGNLEPTAVPEGVITLRLRAEFTDGSSNERRSRLYVDRSPPLLSGIRVEPVWVGQEQGLLVRCIADDNSYAWLSVVDPAGDTLLVAPEEGKVGLTRSHYWILRPHEFTSSSQLEFEIVVRNPAGLETREKIGEHSFPDVGAPAGTFLRSEEAIPYGYILPPDTAHSSADRFLLLNRFSNLSFSRTLLFRRGVEGYQLIDSLGNWVPRGIGDSDGDGLLEALLQATGTGIITEQATGDGTLFASTIFSDTAAGTFYPGAFVDVDLDGIDEIVGHTVDPQTEEDLFTVWKREGSKLVVMAQAPNRTTFPPLSQRNSFGASDVEVADIDGDGHPEFLIGDSDGDVMLFSWSPGSGLVERWRFETDGVDADKLIAMSDIDADGRTDVIMAWQPQPGATDSNEYPVPVWTLRGVSFDAGWNPDLLFEEFFAWPRSVSTFRSGISAGELDDAPGSELVVVLFPDAWVFSWSPVDGQLQPLWGRSGAMINEPAIFPDDSGGPPSFAVGDGEEISFYSIDTTLHDTPIPPVLYGWSNDSSSSYLAWHPVDRAVRYRLYREDPDGDPGRFRLIAETDSLQFIDSGSDRDDGILTSGELYRYLVVAVDDTGAVSRASNLVTVRPHARMVPVELRGVSSEQFIISFSQKLSDRMHRVGALKITDVDEGEIETMTLVAAGDSALLVTLSRSRPGEELFVRGTSLLRDRSGSPADTAVILSLQMPATDEFPRFWIATARPLPGVRIELLFSEPVDPASLAASNFLIEPDVAPIGAEVSPDDGRIVILTLPSDYRLGPYGFTYSVEVLELRSVEGEEIPDGPGSIAGFTIAAESLDLVEAYPQPFSIESGGMLTFAGLPSGGRVEIYTVSGKIIRMLDIDRGDGAIEWDGRDEAGVYPVPGTYLYRVLWLDSTGTELATVLRKLAIVP